MSRYGQRPSERRIERLVSEVAARTSIGEREIRSRSQSPRLVRARWLVWRELRLANFSVYSIARVWGCDHTTILHAEKRGWGLPPTAPAAPTMIWAPRVVEIAA